MDLGILGALMRDEDVIPSRKFNISGKVAHFITEVAGDTCGMVLFDNDHKHSLFSWKKFPERLRTDRSMHKYYNKTGADSGKNWNPIVISYDLCDHDVHLYGTQNDYAAEGILTQLNFDSINPKYHKDLKKIFGSSKTPHKVRMIMITYLLQGDIPSVVSVSNTKVRGLDVEDAIKKAFAEGYSIGVGMHVYDSDDDDDDYTYNAIFMVKHKGGNEMIYNLDDVKLEPGKATILALPAKIDVSDTIEYFAGDSSIAVVPVAAADNESADKNINMACTAYHNKCCVVLLSCTDEVLDHIKVYPGVYAIKDAVDPDGDNEELYPRVIHVADNDLRTAILHMFGWARFPVFTEEQAIQVKKMIYTNYTDDINRAIERGDYDIAFDAHGALVVKTKSPVINLKTKADAIMAARTVGVSLRELEYIAYAGLDFVTFSKDDARAVADLLDEVVEERGGDDVNAFGLSKGISYERLHDRLTGLIYRAHEAAGCESDSPKETKTTPADAPSADKKPAVDRDHPGYHKDENEEMLILEHPSIDCDREWTVEEWATICKLCGLKPDKTTRIVLHVGCMEYFIGTAE